MGAKMMWSIVKPCFMFLMDVCLIVIIDIVCYCLSALESSDINNIAC